MATGAAIASSTSAANSQAAYAQGYNAGATTTAVNTNAAVANANMAAANANIAAANANAAAAGAAAASLFDGTDCVGTSGRLHHAERLAAAGRTTCAAIHGSVRRMAAGGVYYKVVPTP